MPGLSSCARAGSIGARSGRAAFARVGFAGSFFECLAGSRFCGGLLGDFAMVRIWARQDGGERATRDGSPARPAGFILVCGMRFQGWDARAACLTPVIGVRLMGPHRSSAPLQRCRRHHRKPMQDLRARVAVLPHGRSPLRHGSSQREIRYCARLCRCPAVCRDAAGDPAGGRFHRAAVPDRSPHHHRGVLPVSHFCCCCAARCRRGRCGAGSSPPRCVPWSPSR